MLKYNNVHCTGRVQYIRYFRNNNSLLIVLSLYEPKWGGDRYADYPNIYMEGEMAEKYRSRIKRGDYLTVIGYVEEKEIMTNIGNDLFRRTVGPVIIPYTDMVFEDFGHENVNIVHAAGTVTRVYKNPDQGKKFYIINLRTQVEVDGEKKDAVLGVTHFDLDMALEPQVGDYLVFTGTMRTKNNTDDNGRPYKLSSIVAKSVSIIRKEE